MNAQALKINITQRILSLSDERILKKIAAILDDENVVGYDVEGSPIFEKEFVMDINETLQLLNEEKLETFSSEEVKKRILG
jgi:hypothetical protein